MKLKQDRKFIPRSKLKPEGLSLHLFLTSSSFSSCLFLCSLFFPTTNKLSLSQPAGSHVFIPAMWEKSKRFHFQCQISEGRIYGVTDSPLAEWVGAHCVWLLSPWSSVCICCRAIPKKRSASGAFCLFFCVIYLFILLFFPIFFYSWVFSFSYQYFIY